MSEPTVPTMLLLTSHAKRELLAAVERYLDDVQFWRLTTPKSADGVHRLYDRATSTMIDARDQLRALIAVDEALEARQLSALQQTSSVVLG